MLVMCYCVHIVFHTCCICGFVYIWCFVYLSVMKPSQEKIENIDQRLRIQPLQGGNLLYIT